MNTAGLCRSSKNIGTYGLDGLAEQIKSKIESFIDRFYHPKKKQAAIISTTKANLYGSPFECLSLESTFVNLNEQNRKST